ncbi:MAG: tetratricopeptide repeat protein [Nitrospira sp.]|nr:tetratricopeptide repeat protein [Nitrospira sp.]
MQRSTRKLLTTICVVVALVGMGACSSNSKPRALTPLALEAGVPPRAIALNEQGIQAYQAREYEAARTYFSQTVDVATQSGPAHYNYALALNKLGETEAARKQFVDAANLAPGDKIIWDSPVLSPFGNPEMEEKKVAAPQNPNRRSVGGR